MLSESGKEWVRVRAVRTGGRRNRTAAAMRGRESAGRHQECASWSGIAPVSCPRSSTGMCTLAASRGRYTPGTHVPASSAPTASRDQRHHAFLETLPRPSSLAARGVRCSSVTVRRPDFGSPSCLPFGLGLEPPSFRRGPNERRGQELRPSPARARGSRDHATTCPVQLSLKPRE